jgi:DNA polymerase-1
MGNIQEIETFDEFKQKYNINPEEVTFEEIASRLSRRSEYKDFLGYENTAMSSLNIPGVTIVRTVEDAKRAISILYEYKDRVHAWDTETVDLEVKGESPVLNGKVICLQAFLGMDVPFWNGPRLFVDNFCDASGIIQEFKAYFEDKQTTKIWFNYGFDRHVVENHGINMKGFGGDVMHMARLVDPSRMPGDYSLSKCSAFYENEILEAKEEEWDALAAEIDKLEDTGKTKVILSTLLSLIYLYTQ